MAAKPIIHVADKINDLLYVKSYAKVRYCGYRREYLAQNLTEIEEDLLVCKVCTGIMREASFYQEETTCLVCISTPSKLNAAKTVQISISKLEIKCPLIRDCNWKGKLSEAQTHLENCDHFRVECSKCRQVVVTRPELANHENNFCLIRDITCQYCDSSKVANELKEHYNCCNKFIISCPNKCGDNFQRQNLDTHKSTCSLEVITCPYAKYGCMANEMLRKDLLTHKKDFYIEHQDMSLVKRDEQYSLLQREITEMKWSMIKLEGVELEYGFPDELTAGCIMVSFYSNRFKLTVHVSMDCNKDLTFSIFRIEGINDHNLGEAVITHYRVILVDQDNYTNFNYEDGKMNHQLKIGSEKLAFHKISFISYEKYMTADKSLFIRFYFQIDNTLHSSNTE